MENLIHPLFRDNTLPGDYNYSKKKVLILHIDLTLSFNVETFLGAFQTQARKT